MQSMMHAHIREEILFSLPNKQTSRAVQLPYIYLFLSEFLPQWISPHAFGNPFSLEN